MQEILKSPRLIPLLSLALCLGCSPSKMAPNLSKGSQLSKSSVGVIGGDEVSDVDPIHQKILYLALNVQVQSTGKAASGVTWQGHCTASALSSRIVLTAAHCVVDRKPEGMRIVLTPRPSGSPYQPRDWYAIETVRVHEGYTGSNGYLNDLALLLLKSDLPDSTVLKIADAQDVGSSLDLLAIGFGTSTESRDEKEQAAHSETLNLVEKTVASLEPAEKTFAVNQNDHRGFCNGDSGGPGLVYREDSQDYAIVGVVSNVTMLDDQRKMMDPNNEFSLCIGQGNYTNLINPELRQWVDETKAQLLKKN
jgi:hypothetical protein